MLFFKYNLKIIITRISLHERIQSISLTNRILLLKVDDKMRLIVRVFSGMISAEENYKSLSSLNLFDKSFS